MISPPQAAPVRHMLLLAKKAWLPTMLHCLPWSHRKSLEYCPENLLSQPRFGIRTTQLSDLIIRFQISGGLGRHGGPRSRGEKWPSQPAASFFADELRRFPRSVLEVMRANHWKTAMWYSRSRFTDVHQHNMPRALPCWLPRRIPAPCWQLHGSDLTLYLLHLGREKSGGTVCLEEDSALLPGPC